jgi:hypothetical protein
LRARALGATAIVHSLAAEPDALTLAERAHQLAPAAPHAWHIDFESHPTYGFGNVLLWSGQHERARPVLEGLHRELSERNELMQAVVLTGLSIVDLHAGRLAHAADQAELANTIFLEYGVDAEGDTPATIWLALAEAQRGDLDRACLIAERYCSFLHRHDINAAQAEAVIGVARFLRGELPAAEARFAAAERVAHAGGAREPTRYWWRADYAETLLELGAR